MGVSKKPHEYLIVEWHGGGTIDECCLYRTEVHWKWIEKIRELAEVYHISKDLCRVVEREDRTFFSFPSARIAVNAWTFAEYPVKPLKKYYGFPPGVERKG